MSVLPVARVDVLLAEGDASRRDALHRALRASGWTVVSAISGLDALELVEGGLIPRVLVLAEGCAAEGGDLAAHVRADGVVAPVVWLAAEEIPVAEGDLCLPVAATAAVVTRAVERLLRTRDGPARRARAR